jgi:large subunit ribosomal protein L31
MKTGIHPEYGPAVITCGCGNSWETRATKPELRIEVCSKCHPFFTGEQRIVDTAGRVERYRRRFGLQEDAATGAPAAETDADANAADEDAPVDAETEAAAT